MAARNTDRVGIMCSMEALPVIAAQNICPCKRGAADKETWPYISRNELYNEMTQWHKAGGSCLCSGPLCARRLDELEIFFDNEYNREWQLSSHNHPLFILCRIACKARYDLHW